MSKEISADVIAQSFIKQFYEMMSKNPSELHKFYSDESHFLHSEDSQKQESVCGTDAIREHISHLNLTGAIVDVSGGTVDVQRFDDNGIVVVVTGHFSFQWNPEVKQPFIQTFFLAVKAKTTTYFVSNSVFRLITVNQHVATSHPVGHLDSATGLPFFAHPNYPPLPVPPPLYDVHTGAYPHGGIVYHPGPALSPAPIYVAEDHATCVVQNPEAAIEEEYVQVSSADIEAASPTTSSQDETEISVGDGSGSLGAHVTTPAVAAIAAVEREEEIESGSKSYSDIVRKLKASASVTPEITSTVKIRTLQPPRVLTTSTVKVSGKGNGQPVQKSKSGGDKGGAQKRDASRPNDRLFSLYVNQLPQGVTSAELQKLFGGYGPIHSIDVLGDRGFAFVKFETLAGLQGAVAHKTTTELRGKLLRMEERNPQKTTTSTLGAQNAKIKQTSSSASISFGKATTEISDGAAHV